LDVLGSVTSCSQNPQNPTYYIMIKLLLAL